MDQELKGLYQQLEIDIYRYLNINTVFKRLLSCQFLQKLTAHLQALFHSEFHTIKTELSQLRSIKQTQDLAQQLHLNSQIFKENLLTITSHTIQRVYENSLSKVLEQVCESGRAVRKQKEWEEGKKRSVRKQGHEHDEKQRGVKRKGLQNSKVNRKRK